jgi:glycosyltransferase involved in cell wall biosynthesis
MNLPLISIIVPVYNARSYLDRTFRCLLSQTYPNLEIIIVDDGSTDGSAAVCDRYASAAIKVSHTPNRGASLARRTGLELSTGRFVTFMDSDDIIADDYVATLYGLIDRFQAPMSACRVKRIEAGAEAADDGPGESRVMERRELLRRFFRYEFWGLCGKLYPRDAFASVEFPRATLCEDYYVTARLLAARPQMAYTGRAAYFYEIHPGSLSHTRLSAKAFDEFDNVEAVYRLTRSELPGYSGYALSNVVETCVKLLSQLRADRSAAYDDRRRQLKRFLRGRALQIAVSPHIYWKYKILAIYHCVR